MTETAETPQEIFKETCQQITALGDDKRAALVQELADYMVAYPHRNVWKAVHTVAPLAALKSVASASYPTAALMYGNPQLIDAVIYGWVATGIAGIDLAHKKTASPVAQLLHDAVTLADKMQNEKPLPNKYDPEEIERNPKTIVKRTRTMHAAKYLSDNPELLQREQLQRNYGRVITGIALFAAVLAGGDFIYNEELRGPNDRSEKEKEKHRMIDIGTLAALSVGAVGYSTMRRGFFGNSPTEQLIEEARKLNEEAKRGGKTAHYWNTDNEMDSLGR